MSEIILPESADDEDFDWYGERDEGFIVTAERREPTDLEMREEMARKAEMNLLELRYGFDGNPQNPLYSGDYDADFAALSKWSELSSAELEALLSAIDERINEAYALRMWRKCFSVVSVVPDIRINQRMANAHDHMVDTLLTRSRLELEGTMPFGFNIYGGSDFVPSMVGAASQEVKRLDTF